MADTSRSLDVPPDTHRIYANGFTIGMSNADVCIVLQRLGQPEAVVNVSYTLAKTLAQSLGQLVTEWESATGQHLQTTHTIEQKLKSVQKQRHRQDKSE